MSRRNQEQERRPRVTKTYVADITHYLNADGELAEMPGAARRLASFLVLLIDAATQTTPAHNHGMSVAAKLGASFAG